MQQATAIPKPLSQKFGTVALNDELHHSAATRFAVLHYHPLNTRPRTAAEWKELASKYRCLNTIIHQPGTDLDSDVKHLSPGTLHVFRTSALDAVCLAHKHKAALTSETLAICASQYIFNYNFVDVSTLSLHAREQVLRLHNKSASNTPGSARIGFLKDVLRALALVAIAASIGVATAGLYLL